MDFDFLDRRGTKQLGNLMKFLIDPELVEHEGQRTYVGNEGNRHQIITSGLRNLDNQGKERLISEIKDSYKMVDAIIKGLVDFRDLEEKEEVAKFLQDLMANLNNKDLKLRVFGIMNSNCPPKAFEIISQTQEEILKKELCNISISMNKERGYIFSLLNDVDFQGNKKFNVNLLIDEVNYIQFFTEEPILGQILVDLENWGEPIKEINKRIEKQDFSTAYTIAKNIDSKQIEKININKNEFRLLKWIINTQKWTKITKDKLGKKIDSYSNEWLSFLAINLFKIGNYEKEVSIFILKHLLTRKNFIENHGPSLAEDISKFIKDKWESEEELLEILWLFDRDKTFSIVVKAIENEGLELAYKKEMKKYIDKHICKTEEFKWISSIEEVERESQEYKEPDLHLNMKVLTLALMTKTPRANYNILRTVEKNNQTIYSKLMKNYEIIVDKKLADYEKNIQVMIALDYKSNDEGIRDRVKEYQLSNFGIVEGFLKICNSQMLEKHYIKRIKYGINIGDKSILGILDNIEDPEIKTKCRQLVIEDYMETNSENIATVIEKIKSDIDGTIILRELIVKKLKENTIELDRKNLVAINSIGIAPIKLYDLLEGKIDNQVLFDIWHQNDEPGKILNVLRERLIGKIESLVGLDEIQDFLRQYDIKDNSLDTLIKVKAYSLINLELLNLNSRDEDLANQLEKLGSILLSYGLVGRFLADKFIQTELDEKIVDHLFRQFIDSANSKELWSYYWDRIIEDFKLHHHSFDSGKMEMFFQHLTKSKDGIEWFLDLVEIQITDNELQLNIIENLLILVNKQNRIILQNQQEIDQMRDQILINIAKGISWPLSSMEKTIIARRGESGDDILVNNLKRFRDELKTIGIDPVESVENYGERVDFDDNKHENISTINLENGIVDSLGIQVNGKALFLGTLLKKD